MPRKSNPRHQIDTVKAADCIDVTDYVMVHKGYFAGLRNAVREAHTRAVPGGCACVFCAPPVSASAEPK
jgi:hypothetical protein